MNRLAMGACGLAAVLAAFPAAGQTFTFHEGNACRQDRLGSFTSEQFGDGYPHDVTRALRKNDEARSVRIARVAGGRGRVELSLYDAPSRRDADKDDWLHLRVENDRLPPNGVCLQSFDRPRASSGITIVRHKRVNGLDGKVSRASFQRVRHRPAP